MSLPPPESANGRKLSGSSIPIPIGLDGPTKLNEEKSDIPKEYSFKLTSVAFKEAALDSPSFRAHVNHIETQLAHTEDWFVALADSFYKVPQKLEEFSSVVTILDYLVPPFLQDSIVDQEYCLTALDQTKTALKGLWATAFSVFKINVSNIEQRKLEFAQRVADYRKLRRRFLACQENYDRYYSIHMGTPKLKDAALLYEDSLQLSGVRREYLSLSLDLISATHMLTASINATILNLNELFWRIRVENLNGGFLDSSQLDDLWSSVRRVRSWHDACQKAEAKISGDLAMARENIEKHTLSTLAPPASLDEYRPEYINNRVLGDIVELAVEKHGYVCLKTYSEKSSKPIWVKRWAFVKNGVLGFLVLSPSMEAVQETDKIGVLLCSVKHTPNEDRHFCFEIKTIDTTLVLQTETLHELKSWLRVFENLRTRILNSSDSLHVLLDVASSRYPPLVSEFSAARTTAVDREITSTKTYDNYGHVIHSRRLARHMERNEPFFTRYIVGSIGRINLPISTAGTNSALIGISLGTAVQFPTALDANISGSVNWGLVSVVDAQVPFVVKPLEKKQTKQIGVGTIYPKNFPNRWIAKDLQMRALFEASVGPNEYCLLSYNCLISPNENQELRATHYITQSNVYAYINSLGFVSMTKVPLNRFVEAACFSAKTQDILRLILVNGQLVMKLFLDDGMLVERKLNYIFRNLACDAPQDTLEIVDGLLEIERKFEEEKKTKSPEPGLPTHFEFLSSRPQDSYYKSVAFDRLYPLMETRIVGLPPKAVFHVLCGSQSEVLNVLNAMVEMQFSERNAWKKSPNMGKTLIRDNIAAFCLPTGQKGTFNVTQEVEHHVENEFYSVKITKSSLKVTCGPRLRFVARITIQKLEAERSAVSIFGEPIIDENSMYSFVAPRLCRVFIRGFTRHVFKEMDVAINTIGAKGKILKAVYFYGKIVVSEEPYEPLAIEPVPIGRFALLKISSQLVAADVVRLLTTWCFATINTLKMIFHNLTLHMGLFAIIAFLVLSNMYLSALSARSYWVSRQSRNLIKDLVNVEPMKIQRAVYLKDIQDLVNESLAVARDSPCFQTFMNQSVVLNYLKFSGSVSENPSLSFKQQHLRDRLNDIAIARNDLLVSLKMLNQLEEEEAKSEWRSWLVEELATCNQIGSSGILHNNGSDDTSMRFFDYCESCSRELAEISGVL